MTDPYGVLGLPRDATAEQIRSTYRRLAGAHHPDRKGGDAARMAQINAAHDVLKDPVRRALFDEFGEEGLVDGFDPEAARRARSAPRATEPEDDFLATILANARRAHIEQQRLARARAKDEEELALCGWAFRNLIDNVNDLIEAMPLDEEQIDLDDLDDL